MSTNPNSPETPITAQAATDALIKAFAEDIGQDTAAYIKVMYPEAVKAASSTFLLSLRGHIHNQIVAAFKANENGEIIPQSVTTDEHGEFIDHLVQRKQWRREWLATWRKLRKSHTDISA